MTNEVDSGEVAFDYSQTYTQVLQLPSIELGAPDEYSVFLRIRWDEINLASGVIFSLDGIAATVYNGEFAILNTGKTVGELESGSFEVQISLPTMMQNEFENVRFSYEVCVAPGDMDAPFGADVESALTVVQSVTLKETPSLVVDADARVHSVAVGEELTVEVACPDGNSDEIAYYLYQKNSDGLFAVSEKCNGVFEAISVGDDGRLTAADGLPITGNSLTAAISENASRGKYYLAVKLGDKYEYIMIKLTAKTSASTNTTTNASE